MNTKRIARLTDAELIEYYADAIAAESWFVGRHGAPSPAWIAETCEGWSRIKRSLATAEREMARRGMEVAA